MRIPNPHILPTRVSYLLIALLSLLASPIWAQTPGSGTSDDKGAEPAADTRLMIIRDVNGSGGVRMTASNGHALHGTVSQTSIGRVSIENQTTRLDVGFWYWAKTVAPVCVRLPIAEAEPGTTLTIPLLLEQAENMPAGGQLGFRARIRFNRSLLQPVQDTPECLWDGGDCLLDIEGPVTAEMLQTGILAKLQFLVKLGDSESTPLIIEEFEWIGGGERDITTILKHGQFNLLGVCREGGEVRLVHGTGPASRVRVWPNPASGSTEVAFVSREEGPVRVTLVDAIGREVATLAEQTVEAVKLYSINADLSSIPSGSYFLVFRTPTEVKTTRLTIEQ